MSDSESCSALELVNDVLSTGHERLDTFFGGLLLINRGGISTGSITEICGESGTGKSQFAMQLAIQCQLPKEAGGLDGGIIDFIQDVFTYQQAPHSQFVDSHNYGIRLFHPVRNSKNWISLKDCTYHILNLSLLRHMSFHVWAQ